MKVLLDTGENSATCMYIHSTKKGGEIKTAEVWNCCKRAVFIMMPNFKECNEIVHFIL